MRRSRAFLAVSLLFSLALTALLFLSACHPAVQDTGQTFPNPGAHPFKLGDETVQAVSKSASFAFEPERQGTYRFLIGNPAGSQRSVSVGDVALDLAPQAWQSVDVAVKSAGVAVEFEGAPLLWGPPFRLPNTRPTQAPNVLLISIDTLRHDVFSPEQMPELFALFSQQGMIFDSAYSPSPWTLPAHASLLTGELPAQHGIRTPQQKLGNDETTLAELLALVGYYNVAVTEGNYVSAQFGFDQGFHRYTERPPNMMLTDADALSKLQGNWNLLREQVEAASQGTPVFAFFHTYEVHCPYLPHDGLEDPEQLGMTQWLLDNETRGITDDQMALLRALYEGEVRYTDEVLAPSIKVLLDSGDWTVILTSDHGEEFGEHGGILHADTLYEEVLRVPLAIAGAGVDAPQKLKQRVSIMDIVPTVLTLAADAPAPTFLPGRDLLDPALEDATMFAETYFLGPHIPAKDPRIGAVWSGKDKLIQSRNAGSISAELYNLEADPAEQKNLVESDIKRRDALYLFLEAYLEKGQTAPAVGDLSPEQLEVMRTLGYIK